MSCEDKDCDPFNTAFRQRAPFHSPRNTPPYKKWALYGIGLLLLLGGAGWFFFHYERDILKDPIIVHPPSQPLKVKPDTQIEEEVDEIVDDRRVEKPIVKSKPKRQNVIYEKVEKKRWKEGSTAKARPQSEHKKERSSQISYYICFGHFSSHYEASVAWHKIKGDRFDDLRDVEPIVRIVANQDGKPYQLLAGPVSKNVGLRLAEEMKTTLLSVDN